MAENNNDYLSLSEVIQSSKRAQEIAESARQAREGRWQTVEYEELARRANEENRRERLRELNSMMRARDYYAE